MFGRHGHALLALLLVLIASARIISTYNVLSHTVDEPDHLGAGMEWLDRGTFTGDPSHPPLARVLGALGPYLDGSRWVPAESAGPEGVLVLGRDRHYNRVLSLARFGILPLFWVASLTVFVWARRASGPVAAVIAVFLFTTIPPVLAHAGLVTTDMAATAVGAATFCVSLWWAEGPSRWRTVAFGATLGLAALAKFSLLVFLPAAWLLLLAWRRPALSQVRKRFGGLAAAAALGTLLLWAGYRFSFRTIPAWEFFDGLRELIRHNSTGHDGYLLGSHHYTGVWYFFPVVLGVKTPLATLVLLGWSLVLAFRRRLPVGTAATFSAAILLVAMTSRINIGVRHVLPIYAGLSVICAVAAAEVMRGSRLSASCLLALFSWQALSGAAQHPDYIAYTNEIAGAHPEAFVAESDLDWGQDMKEVAAFLKRQSVTHVAFTPYCTSYLDAGETFPQTTPTNWYHPLPGWNVVSLSGWKVYNHPGWVSRYKPLARIGRTHLAWYFP